MNDGWVLDFFLELLYERRTHRLNIIIIVFIIHHFLHALRAFDKLNNKINTTLIILLTTHEF